MASPATELFLEDVNVGRWFTGGKPVVDQAQMTAVAAEFDRPRADRSTWSGEQRRSVVDIRRAADVFGWRPEVSLRDGLARTVEFFRARAVG